MWGISGRKCPCQCWVTEERAALLPAMKIDVFKKEKKNIFHCVCAWGGGEAAALTSQTEGIPLSALWLGFFRPDPGVFPFPSHISHHYERGADVGLT